MFPLKIIKSQSQFTVPFQTTKIFSVSQYPHSKFLQYLCTEIRGYDTFYVAQNYPQCNQVVLPFALFVLPFLSNVPQAVCVTLAAK